MGVSTFYMTQSRNLVIDFTVPFQEESTVILTPAPTEGVQILACLRPFHVKVIGTKVTNIDHSFKFDIFLFTGVDMSTDGALLPPCRLLDL